jgi:hypothetical protein
MELRNWVTFLRIIGTSIINDKKKYKEPFIFLILNFSIKIITGNIKNFDIE